MNEYQEKARTTFLPNNQDTDQYRLILGIFGEAGEIAEKFKKRARGDEKYQDYDDFRLDLMKELGDVMWYIANLAKEFDIEMNDIAEKNVAKLQDRKERGVIKGSGDNR